jgi:hypothetical protein
MITERRPDVSPFSAIESIAIGYPGRSFPNHYVPASNGGFARAVRSAHRQKMADYCPTPTRQ